MLLLGDFQHRWPAPVWSTALLNSISLAGAGRSWLFRDLHVRLRGELLDLQIRTAMTFETERHVGGSPRALKVRDCD